MGRRIGLACMAASAPDGPPLVMPDAGDSSSVRGVERLEVAGR